MTTIVTLIELKNDAKSFVTFKRAMGYRYQRGAYEIDRFLRFLEKQWNDEDVSRCPMRSATGAGALPIARLSRSVASSE